MTAHPDAIDPVQAVEAYYRHVDASQIGQLVSLFTEDAVYHRPGYPPMRGHGELRQFYTTERVIKTGAHVLDKVICCGPSVAVRGTFTGVLRDGTAVTLGFADFFAVAADGRFAERRTFFDSPAV